MDALYTCNIFPKYNNTGKISIAKHNNSEKTTSETKTKIMILVVFHINVKNLAVIGLIQVYY